MREILFRGVFGGKRLDNGKWVDGPTSISQYTGLTDRNGTKIFEGDLLEFTNDDGDTSLYRVAWSDTLAAWTVTEQDKIAGTDMMDYWEPEQWRVVENDKEETLNVEK